VDLTNSLVQISDSGEKGEEIIFCHKGEVLNNCKKWVGSGCLNSHFQL